MTFQKFFDDIWRLKIYRALLFKADDVNAVWDWIKKEERMQGRQFYCNDEKMIDIPVEAIVAIDTKHTEWQSKYFLAERWLNAEVTNIIILNGCVCIFLLPQDEQIGNPDRLEEGE